MSFMFYESFPYTRVFIIFRIFVFILYFFYHWSRSVYIPRDDPRETAFVWCTWIRPGSFVISFYGRFNRFQFDQILYHLDGNSTHYHCYTSEVTPARLSLITPGDFHLIIRLCYFFIIANLYHRPYYILCRNVR